jgi:hypothetical protein
MHGHRDEIINRAECRSAPFVFIQELSMHVSYSSMDLPSCIFFIVGKRASLIDGVEPEDACQKRPTAAPHSLTRFPFLAPLRQPPAARTSPAAAASPPPIHTTTSPDEAASPRPHPRSSGSSAGSPSRTTLLRLGCIAGRRSWPYSARLRHQAPLLAVPGHRAPPFLGGLHRRPPPRLVPPPPSASLSFVDALLILGTQSPCDSVLTRRKAMGRMGKTATASGRCSRPPKPPADAGARRWRPRTPILTSPASTPASGRGFLLACGLSNLGCSPGGLPGP